MQRKPQNENTDGTGSHPANQEKQDQYVLVTQREEKHIRAYALLQKTFGSDDFSDSAAAHVGVDTQILSDLVKFKCVRVFDGRYDLHLVFPASYETPLHCFHVDSDFIQKYQSASFQQPVESKVHKESVKRFFAELNSSPPSSPSDVGEPMNIFKRFRWPFSVYLLLTARFRNLSAYIRYLVYSDLGMTKEAEIERARMGPRV